MAKQRFFNLIVQLSEELSLHYERCFPYVSHVRRDQNAFKVLLSIGGNIGNTKKRFQKLFQRIQRDNNFKLIETSPILKNPPFGYLQQDHFFNAVILLETRIFPKSFLRRILYFERIFGRERSFKNAPRTLDIDIVFFDGFRIRSKDLMIPHKEWQKRSSVIIPLIHLGDKYSLQYKRNIYQAHHSQISPNESL